MPKFQSAIFFFVVQTTTINVNVTTSFFFYQKLLKIFFLTTREFFPSMFGKKISMTKRTQYSNDSPPPHTHTCISHTHTHTYTNTPTWCTCLSTISYPGSFHQFGYHHYDNRVLFPHHSPEVGEGVGHWSLCGYVSLWLLITLEGETK